MKAILKFAGWLYFCALFYLLFVAKRPEPTLARHRMPVNFIPLVHKIDYLETYHGLNGPEKINFYTDLLGNVFVFIPFIFFVRLIFRVKSPGKLLLISLITTISIEFIQFVLSVGVADIDDIILNMLGFCIGLLIVQWGNRTSIKNSFSKMQ